MQTSIFCRTWDFHCQSLKKIHFINKSIFIYFHFYKYLIDIITNLNKLDYLLKLKPFGYLPAHCVAYTHHTVQCSKWYEISDMEVFQITEKNSDPPTNQGAYYGIFL